MTLMGFHSFHSLTRVTPKENVLKASYFRSLFVILGEIYMRDLLYEAAIEYKKLEEIKYRIVVGRKGRSYNIVQHFPMEFFFSFSWVTASYRYNPSI